jgi:hypothetical protein
MVLGLPMQAGKPSSAHGFHGPVPEVMAGLRSSEEEDR